MFFYNQLVKTSSKSERCYSEGGMPCALLLFCWHWISLCWLGSKQHNVYYVVSSNDVMWLQTVFFNWISIVIFLCHLQYTKSQHPRPWLAHQDLHTCSISSYCFKSKWTKKTVLCLSMSLINQVFIICSL